MPIISGGKVIEGAVAREAVRELYGAGVPTSGAGGTGANDVGVGARYTDTTSGKLHLCTAAGASVTWVVAGSQT